MRNSAGIFFPSKRCSEGIVRMIYDKPPLTFEQQADLLLQRGLIADRNELILRLSVVNYYRLSGYLFPYRQEDDSFAPGTTLEAVWRRYTFDRRLRALILDAIERIEVAVRTKLVHHLVHHVPEQAKAPIGAFGHLEINCFPGFKSASDYLKWRLKLAGETDRAKSERFVQHFREKYGSAHRELPLWAVVELMSFGSVLSMASHVLPSVQKQVAGDFGFPDEHFISWLRSLLVLRNACAHHDRIWNRESGKPAAPQRNKFPLWHAEPHIPNDRTGYMLTICHSWLGKISHTTQWKHRLFALFDEFPETPLQPMGLPPNWREHPLWKS